MKTPKADAGKVKDRTLVSCEAKLNHAVVFRREADRTLRPTYEPGSKIGLRPSLFTPLRIGGLLSLHRQGGREEFARGGSRTTA